MRVHCHEGGAEPPITRQEWQELLAANETNTPFQTWEWFISWWRVFGGQKKTLIFTGHEGSRLVGVAPLMVSERPYGGSIVEFTASERSDYCDVLCSGDKEAFLFLVLSNLVNRPDLGWIMNLRNVPEQSSTPAIVKRCSDRLGLGVISDTSICPTLILKRCENIKQISLPRSLRRHFSYLQNHGGLTFRVLHQQDEALNSLEPFFQQHIERWQLKRQTSLFVDETNRQFYEEIVKQASASGWLFFSRLDYKSRPIAFHFGFDYGSTVYWYKPSFALDIGKRSPGRIMIKYLIDYCAKERRDEFDFTLGQEDFKNHYCTDEKRIVALKVFLRKQDYLVEQGVRQVWRMLKWVIPDKAIDGIKERFYE